MIDHAIAQQNQAALLHQSHLEDFLPRDALTLDPTVSIPSRAQFERSELAQHLLNLAYTVMKAGGRHYGWDQWKAHPPEYHLNKAILHITRKHEGAELDAVSQTPHHANGLVRLAMYDYLQHQSVVNGCVSAEHKKPSGCVSAEQNAN